MCMPMNCLYNLPLICLCYQVGSNAGIVGMTKEHLGLALALNVPVFVVVTKIDMCPANILQGGSTGAWSPRWRCITQNQQQTTTVLMHTCLSPNL